MNRTAAVSESEDGEMVGLRVGVAARGEAKWVGDWGAGEDGGVVRVEEGWSVGFVTWGT